VAADHARLAALARGRVRGSVAIIALWLGAALVLVSGLVHLHLWVIAYRHVATLGPLFLLQFALSVVLAIALVVLRWLVLALAGVLLMLGTILGLVLALTTGLFGFTLTFLTSWAYLALASEGAAALLLALAAWLALARRPSVEPSTPR